MIITTYDKIIIIEPFGGIASVKVMLKFKENKGHLYFLEHMLKKSNRYHN